MFIVRGWSPNHPLHPVLVLPALYVFVLIGARGAPVVRPVSIIFLDGLRLPLPPELLTMHIIHLRDHNFGFCVTRRV